MYKPGRVLRNAIAGRNCYCYSTKAAAKDKAFKGEKALIVSKLSGFEFKQTRYKHLTPDELRKKLKQNDVDDYDAMMSNHDSQKEFEADMSLRLQKMGFAVRVVNTFTYDEESVNWADVIFPTGGDGTFLLAAAKVRTNNLPVVGFNSAPEKSEGHLCLPKQYSYNIEKAIEKLREGSFEWLLRSRIRITLTGENCKLVATPLHNFFDKVCHEDSNANPDAESPGPRVVPHLALNEVFIGEMMAAQVSNLIVWPDGAACSSRVKCSGLCVSTGTGSTSWHMSMNRLSARTARAILALLRYPEAERDARAAELVCAYNEALKFRADETKLAYTVREMVCLGVWPKGNRIDGTGFVSSMKIKSGCYDAALVVDGGISYPFNDGAIAEVTVLPEDALLTVQFSE